MGCSQNHRYAITRADGHTSAPFDNLQEAREYFNLIPDYYKPSWVAFHDVGIQQLIDNPDSIQSYCAEESNRMERPPKWSLKKVDEDES